MRRPSLAQQPDLLGASYPSTTSISARRKSLVTGCDAGHRDAVIPSRAGGAKQPKAVNADPSTELTRGAARPRSFHPLCIISTRSSGRHSWAITIFGKEPRHLDHFRHAAAGLPAAAEVSSGSTSPAPSAASTSSAAWSSRWSCRSYAPADACAAAAAAPRSAPWWNGSVRRVGMGGMEGSLE